MAYRRATTCLLALLLAFTLHHALVNGSGDMPPRVGRVCEALLQEVGGYLPTELRCPCTATTLETARSKFRVSKDLYILPGLNEDQCLEHEGHRACKVVDAKSGVQVCTLGRIDVVLPAPNAPDTLDLPTDHKDYLHGIRDQYRNHTCSRGVHEFCSEDGTRVRANVLDLGADPSGQQLKYLSQHVDGTVVGFNIKNQWFRPAVDEFAHAGDFTFVWGYADGCLPFPDASFDYVYSINVMEHATPMEKVLSEVLRVLKPGGLFHARWYPNYFSARGHHIHPDMIQAFAKKYADEGEPGCLTIRYENDGTTIPDWAHLFMDETEYAARLRQSQFGRCPPLIDYVVNTVYHGVGLSRVNVWQVLQFLESTGLAEISRLEFDPSVGHGEQVYYHEVKAIAEKYGSADVLLAGTEMWVTRKEGPMPPRTLRVPPRARRRASR